MDDNNQTSGQPKPEPEECVKEQKITDHFKIMIDKARKAQKLVLIKRADDLLRWGAQEEYDFSKIFGVKGNKEVNIRKYGHNTGWICPYISRHLLSLNPSLAHCRRYSRGER